MKTIIFKQVKHITSDELRHMIRIDFLGNNYDDEDFDEIYMDNTNHQNDHIKIETLREYLDKLEKKGANYVAIDFHVDHGEYEIDGVKIDLATQEEIINRDQREKQYKLNYAKQELERIDKTRSQFIKLIEELSGE